MDSQLIHTISVWAGIGFVFLVLTMGAVIDVLRKDFSSVQVKTFWGIVALIPFVGWFFYLILGWRKGSLASGK